MEKWSDLLITSHLSEDLLDRIKAALPTDTAEDLLPSLALSVETSRDLKALKKAFKKLKSLLPGELNEEITEELQEISEDLSWGLSSQGKYLKRINDWVQTFHQDFLTKDLFRDAVIGGHTDKKVVFVAGKIDSEKNLEKLIEYVFSHNPPYNVLVKIILKGETVTREYSIRKNRGRFSP